MKSNTKKYLNPKIIIFITALFLFILPKVAVAHTVDEIIQKANSIAKQITFALNNNKLSEAQIYTYITTLVTYDEKIYGSALAFNPKFLQGRAFFLHNNVSKDNKVLFSPYVYKDKEQIIKAIDIGNIFRDHGYDYTKWEWYKIPMKKQKSHWSKPYFDKGAGNIKMITHSIPIEDKAILTFDLPYQDND